MRVLPDALGSHSQLALVYADRQLPKPALRAFLDFVAARKDQLPL